MRKNDAAEENKVILLSRKTKQKKPTACSNAKNNLHLPYKDHF